MGARLYLAGPALLLAAFLYAPAAHGAEPSDAGTVRVKADSMSYDQAQDVIQARGNVEVRWDAFTLLSDEATVWQGKNEARAEGKVRLQRVDYSLTSDRITLNYQTEQGVAENADLFIKPRNFHVRGARFIKTGKDDYRLERGTFTTCDGDRPSWKFTASDLDVTIEDYAKGKNAVFYVSDIPIFYTPYILFPVKRERQSGFLFPRLGSSTKKGFYLDLPYYWAISPSQDLTVDLDTETKRGEGIGISYRYLRPNDSEGEYNGYFIYDTQQDRERGYVTMKGRENFSPSLTLTSDVNLTLDRDFFRDYGEASGDYNRQILTSSFFLTKRLQNTALTGEIRYIDDLDAPNNRQTLQRLPVLTLSRTRTPLGTTPFYVGIDSSFTDFYRDDGIRGQRLDLHPALAYYYATPQGIDLSAWTGYRQRVYNAYGADQGRGYHGDGLIDAGAIVSTSVARVYAVNGGNIRAVRHTLIPELGFSYIQQKNQDRLPFFDYDDRPVGQEMVTWSITNYLTAKSLDPAGRSTYRDLLYMRISQGYQVGGSRRDLLTLVDEGRAFTDIRLEARYSPLPLFTVNTDSRYNPYHTRFSTASVGFDLNDHKGNVAGLSYHFAREQVEYAEGKATLLLVNPFVFNYNFRYSFDKGGFLESYYSLEFKRQCWSVTFAYRDRPDNREFVVSFTLAGVGSFGPVKSL